MNALYSVKLGDATGSEPCTLTECKSNLKIDFTTDDTLLTALITAARVQLEQFTGVSIVARQVDLIVTLDGCHLFELPYGPVQGTPTITSLAAYGGTNEPITDFDIYGSTGEFVQIKPQVSGMYAISYDSGYDTLPAALKQAVIHQVAYLYEHRGDEYDVVGLGVTARALAKPFRRVVI